ncbi:hypothetical protein LMG28614_04183 [Paraburkholderia ultramafica]|uniref:Uncharacterized protein n=1 Tax=Paraburkholderia ultramafica TaxID=1544867 RepID=A0A6S7BCE3_9BURK|nr:hypothetical protein [Paraburkholderia ultramafica]CAB3795477.1 hypothetical protein LMG28614_04183 [Paraburkholderia ultramafica]
MKQFTKDELCDYFRSFVGMDGGNLETAKLWLCGIEHGKDCATLEDVTPEHEHDAWSIERRVKEAAGKHRSWPLWEKVAKIVVGIRRNVLEEAGTNPGNLTWQHYRDNYLYGQDSYEFKLNLFPLASPQVNSRNWESTHQAQPELSDKEQYRNLCRNGGRFEFMRELRKTHHPKVIIATGTTSLEDFVSAFGFEGCPHEEIVIGNRDNERRLFVYVDRNAGGSETRLVVTPFLSYRRYCLNTDALLEALASCVARWMSPDDFPECWSD